MSTGFSARLFSLRKELSGAEGRADFLKGEGGEGHLALVSAAVGLVLAAIMLSASPYFPADLIGALYPPTILRVPLLVFAAVLVSLIVLPSSRRFWLAVLPALLFLWLALRFVFAWQGAEISPDLIGGLVPWQDSSQYYSGALSLLNGEGLGSFNARRPINAALLAFRLRLFGGELSYALVFGALVLGLLLLLFGRVIRHSLGTAAGVTAVLIPALFILPLVATSLSEPLGLILGTLGFACLWRSAAEKDHALFAFGLFLLTTALLARIGPVLVLPAIVFWGALWLGPNRFDLRIFLLGVAAGVAALSVPLAYLFVMGRDAGDFQGNFSYTLYGITSGGTDWTQVLSDYPQLYALPESERSAEIYRLAAAAFFDNPLTAFRVYGSGLIEGYFFIVGLAPTFILRAFVYLGLLWCLFTWRRRSSSLLLFAFLGIFLSAPLIMRDGGARVFATVVPLVAILGAIGVAVAVEGARRLLGTHDEKHADAVLTPPPVYARTITAGLVIAMLSSLVPQWNALDAAEADLACGAGEIRAVYVPHRTGMGIHVAEETPESRMSSVDRDAFARDPDYSGIHQLRPLLRELGPPFDIVMTVDPEEGDSRILYAVATEDMSLADRAMVFCGVPIPHEELDWRPLLEDEFLRLTDYRLLAPG